MRLLAALLALAACDRAPQDASPPAPAPAPAAVSDSPGEALERAAQAAGLIDDRAAADPAGVFAQEGDRACIVPARDARFRIGVSVDYGEGQHCVARGTGAGRGRLALDLGTGCRFDARLDGAGLRFPAVLPAACAALCEGRASLAALRAARLGESVAEARRLRGADGTLLCEG